MKIGLKWVHMAWYELILRLDGALWLRIIFKPLLTQKGAIKIQKISTNILSPCQTSQVRSLAARPWVITHTPLTEQHVYKT